MALPLYPRFFSLHEGKPYPQRRQGIGPRPYSLADAGSQLICLRNPTEGLLAGFSILALGRGPDGAVEGPTLDPLDLLGHRDGHRDDP